MLIRDRGDQQPHWAGQVRPRPQSRGGQPQSVRAPTAIHEAPEPPIARWPSVQPAWPVRRSPLAILNPLFRPAHAMDSREAGSVKCAPAEPASGTSGTLDVS